MAEGNPLLLGFSESAAWLNPPIPYRHWNEVHVLIMQNWNVRVWSVAHFNKKGHPIRRSSGLDETKTSGLY
jgi:hypothetical protein